MINKKHIGYLKINSKTALFWNDINHWIRIGACIIIA